MPGPIDIDPSTIRSKEEIAYQDADGNWRAGPQAFGYGKELDSEGNVKNPYPGQGEFVSADYANTARGIRRKTNLVKSIQRSKEVDESEAREAADEMIDALQDAETEEERKDIWQKYGSP